MCPLPQKAYSPAWKGLMRAFPFMRRLAYQYYYQTLVHTFSAATVGNKPLQKLLAWICRRNLEKNVPDAALRQRLTPDYDATCKRLIFCSDFYPAISSAHAHLVTDAIERIEPGGVRTADGALHELDVLVYATGFDAAAFILPTEVIGEDGANLEQQWEGSPRAHRAVSMPGFPNVWMLEGPTGPIGNLSLILISEHQVDYIISMLNRMRDDGLRAIAPKQSAFEDYNAAMAEAIKGTTWVTGGCTSWYFDKSGQPNLYPWFPVRYLKDMHNPDFTEYHLVK
jgi:cation diffusion facilitator CzcD-associated flavoprotein CzcO